MSAIMLERIMLPNIVCARDSKHQNVGQYLTSRVGTYFIKYSLNGPGFTAKKGLCKNSVLV